MTPSGNGDLTPSETTLVLDEDYEVKIVTDLETGQETMTILFLKEISKAYEISYLSQLLLKDGNNNVTNKVSVKGDNEKVTVENVSEKVDVYHVDSGGTSSGKSTEIYLKKENDHGKTLAGITFNLLHGTTRKIVRSVTTDEEGLIHFKNILTGTYYLQEVKGLDGYLNSDKLLKGLEKIEVKAGDYPKSNPLVLVNVLNEVELFKADSAGNGIGGALFSLAKKDETGAYQPVLGYENIQSEEKTGRVFIEGLVNGEYRLTETAAIAGYIKNAMPIDFAIFGNEEHRLELGQFTNYQGQAQLQKNDANGDGLAGATFNLRDEQFRVVQENVLSDKNGLVSFNDLAPGKYTVVEVAAPTDYLLNKTVKEFEIVSEFEGEPTLIELGSLVNYQGSAELTKVDEKKTPLAGAMFGLFTKAGESVKTDLVTDNQGKINVTGLGSGEYYFQEITAAPGYLLNTETYEFTIAEEANKTPEIITAPQAINYQGSASFTKTDESGKALAGAEFKVVDEAGKTVVKTILSNDKGEVFVEGLAPGAYYFEETKAPTGHVINTKTIEFDIPTENNGKPAVVKVDDLVNYQGSAELIKKDSKGTSIAGAEFKVIDSNDKTVAENLVSTKQGIVTVKDLAPGAYRFVETNAPKGYILNTTPQEFTIAATYKGKPEAEKAGELINYQGSVELHKIAENDAPLKAAEFSLYNEAGKELKKGLKTDKTGKLRVAELAPGSYYFQETQAPTGYILNTEKVAFTIANSAQGQPTSSTVTAVNYQGTASLLKVSETEEAIPGAMFNVVSKDHQDTKGDDLIVQTGLESATDGSVKALNLAPGNYAFVEVKAAAGYILNTAETLFTIEAKAAAKPATVEAGTLINYQGKVHFKKINGRQMTRALHGLEGAEFTLTKLAAFSASKQNPKVYTADEKGEVIIEGLAPGKYVLEETQAPVGYIKRLEPIVFEIAPSALGEPENAYTFSEGLVYENYQGTAELVKAAENGEKLADAHFKLINTDTGDVVKADLISDEAGRVRASQLAPGNYAFVETQAPTGYLLNQTHVPFTIAESSEDGKVDISGLELINYQGTVSLAKVDANGQALAGAEFSLYNQAGEVFEDSVFKTDEAGKIMVSGLVPGTYYFQETKAPAGYILNNEKQQFTIADSASEKPEEVAVTAVNYQGTARLSKVTEKQKALAGAVFNVVSKEQKDEDGNDLIIQTGLKSAADGSVEVSELGPGNYAFVEVEAAAGYILNTTEVPFEIKAEQTGQPLTVDAGTFINYQGAVSLTKVAHETQGALAGATFNLLDEAGKIVSEGLKTDEQGQVVVENLAPGNYQFVETEAPRGYQLETTAVAFTIEATSAGKPALVKLEKVNKAVVPVVKGSKTTKGTKKTVEQDLPQAGAKESLLLVVAGMILIVSAWLGKRRWTA